MISIKAKTLLNDSRVIDEINKHKWLESEKVGFDIGFDKAAEDWVQRYAADWEKKNFKKTALKSTKKATKELNGNGKRLERKSARSIKKRP